MSHEKQMRELCGLYGEQSDEQLFELHEGREDLTDVAQEALAWVMKERGLEGSAGGEADLGGVGVLEDEAALYTFDNGRDATAAVGALEQAGIWLRVSDQGSGLASNTRSQPYGGLTVIVKQRDLDSAAGLLQRKMGLFPGAEVEDVEGFELKGVDGMVLLSMFDRSEGLVVAEALGRAGISYCWRDGSEEVGELPDEMTVAIEVRASRLGEAGEVVARVGQV